MILRTGQILAIIWIGLNTLVLAPYTIYQMYKFNKNKNASSFIYERKPNMVIIFSVFALLTVGVAMPLGYGWEIFSNKRLQTEHYGYILILYFLGATFIISFWRAWHIWFDVQHKMEAATNTWAKHLESKEKELFTKYRTTFGNPKWTRKYFIMIAAVLSVIFAVLIGLNQLVVVEGIVCVTITAVFVALLVVIKKLSQINDSIMLRQEYLLFGSFGIAYGIVYAILFIAFHDWNEPDPTNLEVLYDALYMILPSPILYILILIQTQWVLYQYNKFKNNKPAYANNNHQDVNDVNINLKDIMCDFEGYKAFMEYLIKCVSAENLLFVSESIQFMNDITKKYKIRATSVQLQTYFDQYSIPKILPSSSIMSKINPTSIRFLRLCEKYILEDSEFEINISHKNRKNLIMVYRIIEKKINKLNPKINKLANIFGDDSILTASRRASKTNYDKSKAPKTVPNMKTSGSASTSELDIKSDDEDKDDDNDTNKKHENNQLRHSCVEDSQLLPSAAIIKNIYDYLCHTLGDVHTNLNDGCIRFMQTDTYFRWYDNIKKERVLVEQDEPDDDDDDTDNDSKKNDINNQDIKIELQSVNDDNNNNNDNDNNNANNNHPRTPTDEQNETKPMKPT